MTNIREFSSKQSAMGSTTSGSAATRSSLRPGRILKVKRARLDSVGGMRGRSEAETAGSAADKELNRATEHRESTERRRAMRLQALTIARFMLIVAGDLAQLCDQRRVHHRASLSCDRIVDCGCRGF